ncbi:MAG: response regulator [Fibrobacteria bacterium]|nr:response regulator [Fibrobacteria bacterium]
MNEAKKKTVLIVDDDKIIRTNLEKEVKRNFYHTLIAEDGTSALELFNNNDVDILLLDVNLPDMNGLDVLEQVKKIKPETEVIVITGFGTQDVAIRSLRRGAIDYIEKPINTDGLAAALGRAQEKINEKEELSYKNTLLVVDDEEPIVKHMTRFLKREGFQVFGAYNGKEGLEIMDENKIDVIITDFRMPQMTGVELLMEAKKLHPDIEGIMVTGESGENIAVDALRAGALDYISKPINLDDLLFSVTKAIDVINLNRTRLYRNRELKISQEIIARMNEELERKIEERSEELNKVQVQLFQTSKLATLGEMAAGLAHEINQPLAGISLIVTNFRRFSARNKLSQEILDEGLADIEESVKRMSEVIKHVRTFARQETMKIVEVDINNTIKSSLKLLSEQLRIHDIGIELNLDQELPKISGEPYQIEQVWINLISNARDAMDEKFTKQKDTDYKKKLVITTQQTANGKEVEIIVKDNGPGLSKEKQTKIFEPFFTTKEVGKGTGLGLSISYGIIENHSGTIGIESIEGEETTMKVTIPIDRKNE